MKHKSNHIIMKNKSRQIALKAFTAASIALGALLLPGCKSFQASNVTGSASYTSGGNTVSGSDSVGSVSIGN